MRLLEMLVTTTCTESAFSVQVNHPPALFFRFCKPPLAPERPQAHDIWLTVTVKTHYAHL
jgi:hypothetical protein